MTRSEQRPIISIVMPTYNRATTIARAVQSVLSQSEPRWELLIVDDGSQDATGEIVDGYRDRRIIYLRSSHRGAATARNIGVERSNAEFVTFLDSDDEAMPSWLKQVTASLSAGADIVSGGFEVVWPEGLGSAIRRTPSDLGPLFPDIVGRFTNSGIYALRRSIFDETGGFADDLRASQHTEFSYRFLPVVMARGGKIDCLKGPLIRYYAHREDSMRKDDSALLSAVEYIVGRHQELLRADPRTLANYYAVAGVSAARLGKYQTARSHLWRSVMSQPLSLRRWARMVRASNPLTRPGWTRPDSDSTVAQGDLPRRH